MGGSYMEPRLTRTGAEHVLRIGMTFACGVGARGRAAMTLGLLRLGVAVASITLLASSIVAARDLVPVSTELGAAPVDCLVNIVGELRPTRASGGSVAEYSVGLDCAPIYRGERALTAAEKAGLGGGVSLQVFTRAC